MAEAEPGGWAFRVSKALMGLARTSYHALPPDLRTRVEDRFFYAVFNTFYVKFKLMLNSYMLSDIGF